jgi:hypothetical protein
LQEGQSISAFGFRALTSKLVSHEEHFRFAGLLSTPQIRTFEHSGQPIRSSRHFRRVTSCSIFTSALHIIQTNSPRPLGNRLSQRGQVKSGGEILDWVKRDSSSDMISTPLKMNQEVFLPVIFKLSKVAVSISIFVPARLANSLNIVFAAA